MNETASIPGSEPRSLWIRALYMLLMALAFQIAAWVLVLTAIVQLVLAAAAGGSNERLRGFGRGVGRYLGQIAGFVTFASEDLPFPFSDWPATPAD